MKFISQAYQSTLAILIILSIFLPTFINPSVKAIANNIIQNPSFETLSGVNPTGWTRTATGNIDAYFEVTSGEAKTGQRSAYFETNGGAGEAYWMPASVNVAGNVSHTYSLWYTANKPLTVKASYRLVNGTNQVLTLGTLTASSGSYKQTAITFVTPQTAVSVSIFVAMQGVSWGNIDDVSLVSNAKGAAVVSGPSIGTTNSTPTVVSPTVASGNNPVATQNTTTTTPVVTTTTTAQQPLQPTPTTGENLIQNPSFETLVGANPTAWTPVKSGAIDAYFEVTSGEAKTGQRSAYFETNGGAGEAFWMPKSIPISGGRNMTFSLQYLGNKQLDLKAQYTLQSGEKTFAILGKLTPTTSYKPFSFNFTTPPSATTISTYVTMSGIGWASIDDVSLINSTITPSNQQPSPSLVTPITPPIDPTPTQLQREGRWRTVGQTSLVAIQAATLPGGKVLLFDGTDGVAQNGVIDDNRTLNYEVFDATARTAQRFQAKDSTNNLIKYAAFCAGMAVLPGGEVFFAGGDTNGDAFGSKKAGIFNAVTNIWRMVAPMNYLRWYPSAIQTLTGDILVVGGTQETYDTPATTPEIYSTTTNTWRELAGATDNNDADYGGSAHFYPWLYNLPNGNVANLGPRPTISTINTAGNGTITNYAFRDLYDNDTKFSARSQQYGSVARISTNQVLALGGGVDPLGFIPNLPANWELVDNQNSTETANLIDLQRIAQAPQTAGGQDKDFTTQVANPITPRTNAALVITANGDVMYTGGSTANESKSRNAQYDTAVQTPEIWNQSSNTWRSLAPHPTKRIYHMTAILQRDGTILQAGGSGFNGQCTQARNGADVTVKGANACREVEVYEPGYLFDRNGGYRNRPLITGSTAVNLTAGKTFTLNANTPISQVTFVRPGAMTHGTNIEQYFMKPQITYSGNSASVTLPNTNFEAPKGQYFMFVWDANGTPSVAQEITIN